MTNLISAKVAYKCFILIVALLLFPKHLYAFDSSIIPFLEKKPEFTIALKNSKVLRQILNDELTRQRKTNSRLQQYTEQRKIARYEVELLTQRLKAEGYYKSQIKYAFEGITINYTIEPGSAYRIESVELTIPANANQPPKNNLDVNKGEILKAVHVLSTRNNIETHIFESSCLFEIVVDYKVLIDHQTHTAKVYFTVNESPSVTFGPITFKGLATIEENYLLDRLSIKEGQCFKRKKIDNARLKLIQTNLLISVNADIQTPNNNAVPIQLTVIERKHRTMSVGLGFDSEKGLGVSTGWKHRNLFGRAQQLNTELQLTNQSKALSTSLTLPNFRSNKQSISFYTELETETTDAFESETGALGVKLSRQLKSNLRAITGPNLSFSKVIEDGEEDSFALLSLLMGLEYDKRNNILDPQKGWIISSSLTPFGDAYETSTRYLKTTLSASAYHTFDKSKWRPTLAVRTSYGTITGTDKQSIPANERFYVGGGGSVRGYGYQSLGPLTDGEPDGGLSFSEVSFETRLRWGEHWGGVLFLDGGFAYDSEKPKWMETHFWGAGVGIRYYTSFAPIRFDIGTPLDKRDGIDDSFQVYISIGQAF